MTMTRVISNVNYIIISTWYILYPKSAEAMHKIINILISKSEAHISLNKNNKITYLKPNQNLFLLLYEICAEKCN